MSSNEEDFFDNQKSFIVNFSKISTLKLPLLLILLNFPARNHAPSTQGSHRGRGAQGFKLNSTQGPASSNSTSAQLSPRMSRNFPETNRPSPTLGLGRGGVANNGGRGASTNNANLGRQNNRPETSNWNAGGNKSPAFCRGNYQQDYNRGEMSNSRSNSTAQSYQNQRATNYSPYQQKSGYIFDTEYRFDNRHQNNYQTNVNSRSPQQDRTANYQGKAQRGNYQGRNDYPGPNRQNQGKDDYARPNRQNQGRYQQQSLFEEQYQGRNDYREEEEQYYDEDYLNDNEVEETLQEDFDEDEETDDEESDLDDEDSDDEDKHADKPPLLREIFKSGNSFSEKMAYVADQLLILTMSAASNCGYSNFKTFSRDFYEHYKFNADALADYLGYNDFQSLCLNAPEIVCIHTWDINETPNGNKIVVNYRPRHVDKKTEKVIEERRISEKEKILRRNEIEKEVDRVMRKEVLPTVKEIDFNYRLCKTLNHLNGLKYPINMDQFKKTYERFYDEPLNAELYRDMYGMKTNKDMKKIQVESMLFEAHIRSNNNNNGLIYKLRRPLDTIKQYHDRLKQELAKREQEEQALADRVKLKNMAAPEFFAPVYGRKTPPPTRYKAKDFETLEDEFENTFSFG